ncbi:MAG: DEAD/DEAH box helicase family protein [Anaerolineales bacterium]|nr:DEAD/DEAH box helicase family protein [Anaerolineales bacterium]
MTRLANVEKAGYFPTPPLVTQLLTSHILAPHGGRILDPCAGEGTALATFANALSLDAYGIELDSDRAAQLRQLLPAGHALAADYRFLKTEQDAFNILYVNPPYLFVEDKEMGRAEYEWLVNTRKYLQPDGLLLWVVPAHMLNHQKSVEHLLSWYDELEIVRFPDGEYERFKQVIVIGYRRAAATVFDPELAASIRRLNPLQLPTISYPELPVFALPKLHRKTITFTSRFINPEDAFTELTTSGITTGEDFQNHLQPTSVATPLSPLMPLKIGHINSIIAAGHLNNQLLQNDAGERILIKGRTYKTSVVTQNTVALDDGNQQVTTTATEHAITDITTLMPDGTIEKPDVEKFLAAWLPQLTDHIAQDYPPRYTFELGKYKAILNSLNLKRIIPNTTMRGLLPAQKHAAAAIATQLEQTNNAILVGEMGTGKTVTGTAIAAAIKAKHTIVLCPPHLVDKWIREVEITWPDATAMALEKISDVDAFFAHAGPIVGVMKETAARSASGWHHSFNYHGPATMPTRNSKQPWQLSHHTKAAPRTYQHLQAKFSSRKSAEYYGRREIQCPTCGKPIRTNYGETITPAHFQQQQLRCQHCANPLYQEARRFSPSQQPGSFSHFANIEERFHDLQQRPDGHLKQGLLQNLHGRQAQTQGYAKIPLATYINRRYKRRLDLLLADEIHQFKAGDSDRGYAFHRLVVAAKKTVGLTGTIYGGKASSLFHLLYRLVPEMKAEWKHNDVTKWVSRYGILQEETTVTLDCDGKQTGNKRSKTSVKEMPGGTPDMLPWLLNRSVFMSLSDMGFALPDYQEIPVTVTMSRAQAAMYADLQQQLMTELKERLIKNDRSLLAAYLQSLLSWPDSSWRPKVIRDPKKRDEREKLEKAGIKVPDNFDLVARINGLPDYPHEFPKEERIIKLIQDELKNGRKCLLLCQQTGTLDITPQWLEMLNKYDYIRAAVLDVEPGKRESWVKKQVEKGTNVIISHPKRVETGLDLLEFPTIIWMGTEYSAYTVLQASRRSWRIGQTQPVKVYFFCYEETLQEDALHLIAAKVGAVQRINGETVSDDTLADLDELASTDILTTLAKIATGQQERLTTSSLQHAFSAANETIQHANGTIGRYDMPAEEPQIIETQPEPIIETVKLPTFKIIDAEQTAVSAPKKRLVFGEGWVSADKLPDPMSSNGRSTVKAKSSPAPAPAPANRIPIPGTNHDYHPASLASWWAVIAAISRHKDLATRINQIESAIAALTVETCYLADQSTATKVMKFLKRNRPPRGHRHDHPTTPLLVALRNRLFQLNSAADAPNGETLVSPQANHPTPVGQTAVSTPHTPDPTPPTADPNGSTPTRLIFGQTSSSFGRKAKRPPVPSAQLSLFG